MISSYSLGSGDNFGAGSGSLGTSSTTTKVVVEGVIVVVVEVVVGVVVVIFAGALAFEWSLPRYVVNSK